MLKRCFKHFPTNYDKKLYWHTKHLNNQYVNCKCSFWKVKASEKEFIDFSQKYLETPKKLFQFHINTMYMQQLIFSETGIVHKDFQNVSVPF